MDFQKQIRFSWNSNSPDTTRIPLLFAARMLVIFLIWVRGMKHILPPFLPFIPGMEILREFAWVYTLLDWLYWVSLVAVFAGIRFQQFSIILGALVLFVILGAKPQFSNSFLFSGCLLFLIGVYRPGLEWVFRVQIALLYLGAGINKLFDPDWLSGRYFEFFLSEVYVNPISRVLTSLFEVGVLGITLSWATIFIELTFGIWALVGRKTVLLFLLIQLFHLSMLVLTLGELSFIFYFLMSVGGYLILPWDELRGKKIRYSADSRFEDLLKFLDSEKFFTWEEAPLKYGMNFFQKVSSRLQYFLLKPLFYGLFVVGITLICMYKVKVSFLIEFLWWKILSVHPV